MQTKPTFVGYSPRRRAWFVWGRLQSRRPSSSARRRRYEWVSPRRRAWFAQQRLQPYQNIALFETPIGKCFQLEIVSFLQGRLGTCPYYKYPVGARSQRAQNRAILCWRHL
ncbi:MAG: hypothetical protein NZ874_08600 [Fimbriimonadales bacterium]|nr:hypothetical protein [Fimbriimonadales bacterium]